MRLDKKLLLIAPTIVLIFVAAGVFYAASQLSVLGAVGDSWTNRSDFVGAAERGEKPLSQQQAITMLQLSLDVEAKRTAAIAANRDLLTELGVIALVACGVLAMGIRTVPREHWPRFGSGAGPGASD
ncbi:MAG: hypothetical protein ABI205_08135 [Gemmatimonadaceae bacterium]